MAKKKLRSNEQPESVYDDWQLVLFDKYSTEELIAALIEHCKRLQEKVVALRFQANRLSYQIPECREPYPEIHHDLYEQFEDYPAYSKYEHIFRRHRFE